MIKINILFYSQMFKLRVELLSVLLIIDLLFAYKLNVLLACKNYM
jgi:hypothetical protein